jgi:hypothetical protein
VTLIPAYSPEARGRSERAFRTLQDRLPNELALAGITEMAAANRYLTEHFLPQHNTRFMVGATEPGTAFIPWIGTPLAEILCVHEERGVTKDNTVRYQGTILQIPQDPPPVPFREGYGAGPRVSGWHPGRLPWPPVSGALSRRWPALRRHPTKTVSRMVRGTSDGEPIVERRPIVSDNVLGAGAKTTA